MTPTHQNQGPKRHRQAIMKDMSSNVWSDVVPTCTRKDMVDGVLPLSDVGGFQVGSKPEGLRRHNSHRCRQGCSLENIQEGFFLAYHAMVPDPV